MGTSVPPSADDDLIRRIRAGEDMAFRVLFERYAQRTWAFLFQLLRERTRADDVLQQTWLNVFRGLASYSLGTNFVGWLFRIARNAAVSERRQAPCAGSLAEPATLPDPRAGQAVLDHDDREVLEFCLGKLNAREQFVIRNTLAGCSSQEIGRQWEHERREPLAPANVDQIRKRAREKLKTCVAGQNHDAADR